MAKLAGKESGGELRTTLAVNPEAGAVIKGTGGARKLRWARPSIGKSGGVRVIYYFQDEQGRRIWLIAVYAKNDKDDLSDAEANELKALIATLKKEEKDDGKAKKR